MRQITSIFPQKSMDELYKQCCGPRQFSFKAVKIQRESGMTWLEIVADWIAMYVAIPIEIALGSYFGLFNKYVTKPLMKGALRCYQRLEAHNWWSLPPNWAAKWSCRKAWGK